MSEIAFEGSAAKAPLVSVMLVNWNTRDMTLECLASVYAETPDTQFEVILVDNASSDGSAQAIAEQFPQATLMAETHNHGFAHATNISAEKAKGKYVLLLNTDTVVQPGAIDQLVAFAKARPEAKIWGGRTLFGDGSLNPTSVWGKITPWSQACMSSGLAAMFPNSSLFNPECYGGWQRNSERSVDIIQGAFFLIERKFWEELGGFDPVFFMYGEEADLCHRARDLGASPRMTPTAQIIHYGGQSSASQWRKIIYVYGARMGLMQRYFAPKWRPIGRFMILFAAAWRALAYGAAAKVTGKYVEAADNWRIVWQRRDLWRGGPVQTQLD
ncbi:MAG: glycosyltransferase family 2 protein [Marinomonas sp.]